MTANSLCMTVDVEDFYEGMSVLGHDVPRRGLDPAGGLGSLLAGLGAIDGRPAVTLFVVGHYADRIRSPLAEFAAAGHEIASHGPDHGRLSAEGIVTWLRKGREMLEDLLGVSVTGFRSPRFDVPEGMELMRYRDALAEAGYDYVSDASYLGAGSPLRELPVLSWRGVHVGGGSYQRLLPTAAVTRAMAHQSGPAVLYYHSYDFDGTLPGVRDVRSAALAKQVLGRRRIATIFQNLTRRFGSETCRHAAR
jgi:peptidoglycan/xylan/chitin deacetylase (PgdA/CDA1 family)